MGSIGPSVVEAAEELERSGISAAVVIVASVSPSPTDDIIRLVSAHQRAVTVEAHVSNGGIGSIVAEIIAESGAACRLVRMGVDRPYGGRGGSEAFLHQTHGLSAECIADRVRGLLEQKSAS